MGITQKSYDAFAKLWGRPAKDVWSLTLGDVRAFYITEYWIPMRLRQVDYQPLADALFSFGVNQGRKVAVRRLQLILGLKTDGIMGVETAAAIKAHPPVGLLETFLLHTVDFYDTLIARRPALARFETGWKNRVYAYQVAA